MATKQCKSESEAREMIAAVSNWLRTGGVGLEKTSGAFESQHERLARDLAREILNAANVNGMHGCPLCCS